jgi:hypothetical protein
MSQKAERGERDFDLREVDSNMFKISDDTIDYSISSGDLAAVQSCNGSVSVLLPRNSIPFHGKLVRVTDLRPIAVRGSVNTVLIPRSVRRIYGRIFAYRSCWTSLLFEFGGELRLIGLSDFRDCPL